MAAATIFSPKRPGAAAHPSSRHLLGAESDIVETTLVCTWFLGDVVVSVRLPLCLALWQPLLLQERPRGESRACLVYCGASRTNADEMELLHMYKSKELWMIQMGLISLRCASWEDRVCMCFVAFGWELSSSAIRAVGVSQETGLCLFQDHPLPTAAAATHPLPPAPGAGVVHHTRVGFWVLSRAVRTGRDDPRVSNTQDKSKELDARV